MAKSFNRNPLKRRHNAAFERFKRDQESGSGFIPLEKEYIKAATSTEDPVIFGDRTFTEMGLHPAVLALLHTKGFDRATQIQDQVFETIVSGRDVLGVAQTGTGKTAAFLLPLIHRQLTDGNRFGSLVLVPTRELALQVEQEFSDLTKGLNFYSACFIGGRGVKQDIQRLNRPLHLVVGTPGRLLDLIKRKMLKLHDYQVLILDEFDKMLDMGFLEDTVKISTAMKSLKQTLLFSATVEGRAKEIYPRFLSNPEEFKVHSGYTTSERVEENIIRVPAGTKKIDRLAEVLRGEEFSRVLVFAETKLNVQYVAVKLQRLGIAADAIHGDKRQQDRKNALAKFKSGEIRVLVATDIAARGIDVDDISHVINYERPQNRETYLHRIGRTGRAGKAGIALTFVD